MRTLIIICMALALGACAGGANLVAKKQTPNTVAFATLASFGSFEMQTAPLYTRLALLRHNATRQLTKANISVGTAKEIQAGADLARVELKQAAEYDAVKKTNNAQASLAVALQLIENLERKLP